MTGYERAWNTVERILDISEESDYVKRTCKIAFDHAWNFRQVEIDELKEEIK